MARDNKPLDHRRVAAQRRFADQVTARPERRVPPQRLRSLGLTQEDLDAMRDGSWVSPEAPPDRFTVRVNEAVQTVMAPIQQAAADVRDALQAVIDDPHPKQADLTSAIQAAAQIAIAIADTAPTPEPEEEGQP